MAAPQGEGEVVPISRGSASLGVGEVGPSRGPVAHSIPHLPGVGPVEWGLLETARGELRAWQSSLGAALWDRWGLEVVCERCERLVGPGLRQGDDPRCSPTLGRAPDQCLVTVLVGP